MYERTRARGFGAEVKRRIMLGTYALSSGYYEAYYGQAQKVRTRIAQDFAAAFERFDFLVTPTSPTVAFELGAKTADPLGDVHERLLHGADAAGRASRRSRSRPGWPRRPAAARSCRSASRSPAPRSPSRGCSTPPTRSSERSASTRGRRVMSVAEIEAAVREALDSLPDWVRRRARRGRRDRRGLAPDGLMGIYDPVGGLQRIVVFRDANPNADEVKRTVLHEIGHHFGMNEEQIDSLGFG